MGLSELAYMLEVGRQAIIQGRLKATYQELVSGAIQAVHEINCPEPDDRWKRKERWQRLKAERIKAGLCPYCGKRPPARGKKMCIVCGGV